MRCIREKFDFTEKLSENNVSKIGKMDQKFLFERFLGASRQEKVPTGSYVPRGTNVLVGTDVSSSTSITLEQNHQKGTENVLERNIYGTSSTSIINTKTFQNVPQIFGKVPPPKSSMVHDVNVSTGVPNLILGRTGTSLALLSRKLSTCIEKGVFLNDNLRNNFGNNLQRNNLQKNNLENNPGNNLHQNNCGNNLGNNLENNSGNNLQNNFGNSLRNNCGNNFKNNFTRSSIFQLNRVICMPRLAI